MNHLLMIVAVFALTTTSCISKKTLEALQGDYDQAQRDLAKCGEDLTAQMALVDQCEADKQSLRSNIQNLQGQVENRDGQINDLRSQIDDLKSQRATQVKQVEGLTVLSQSANDNINRTLGQLEQRDQYIRLLQNAKTKADSINLALSANLKSTLSQGIADQDIDVELDKTEEMTSR